VSPEVAATPADLEPARVAAAVPWEAVLDELADRLRRYQQALQGRCPLPEPYVVPEPAGPLPEHLAARARVILAGQRDVEYQLRARMGAMAGAMAGVGRAAASPAPEFLDRRS
jgi:hypothetical protein